MSIKIKVTCACGAEVAEKEMSEPQTIHYPFKLPEYRCQICGSNAALAYMWKCARCNTVEHGVHNHRLDVHKGEKAVP